MFTTQPGRAVAVLLASLFVSIGLARFEWRDVVQEVTLLPDGAVAVRDERTLWTPDEDFAEAFICVGHSEAHIFTPLTAATIPPSPEVEGFFQPCLGGTELSVVHPERVRESRVVFEYELQGTMQAHSDVVQWYWNLLQLERPAVVGYRLEVRAPGPMAPPYDAFVMRYGNPEAPRVTLSSDRSLLRVEFDRIPEGLGVEVRYLMDPRLFTLEGGAPALEEYLLDQQWSMESRPSSKPICADGVTLPGSWPQQR